MTSAYERTNAVPTDSGGGGGSSRGKPHWGSKLKKKCLLFLARFVSNLYSSCLSTIGDIDLNFEDIIFFLNENMKDNDRGQE